MSVGLAWARRLALLWCGGLGLGCPYDDREPMPHPPTVLAAGPMATVLGEARLACLDEPAWDALGRPVTCEPSGAARLGEAIWVANDKPLPDRSSMMELSVELLGALLGALDGRTEAASAPTTVTPTRYAAEPAWLAPRKLEGLAAWPDGRGLLAMTAFDRVDPSSAALDPYDMLLSWVPGEAPVIVEPSTRDGVTSSVGLRDRIRRALGTPEAPRGPPHVKLEGLALLPDGRLLMGVREEGEHWYTPRYVVKILQTRWSAEQPERLGAPIELRWSWTPAEPDIVRPLGLSGLEWDPEHERLLLLTSVEVGVRPEDLDAYAWILPLSDYDAGRPPTPVRANDGTRLSFAHKAEAIVPLGGDRVLVIHDDDRVLTGAPPRALHEAALTVLRIDG